MFQTLGCFHSLQPTGSPFETPRIPCLTPIGFARWQTIQLLLCPEENVEFIQKAVQLWNVPMPNGGTYPKSIPKEMFPDRPDEAMEKWHKMVTGKLNQQNYNNMRRIKNSPYQSPHPEPYDRRDGYFSGSHVGRPARPSRSSSRDDDQLASLYRRRSSVPDFPSPSGERGSHWDPRNQQEARKARSHSAQRSSPIPPVRQRSRTTTNPPGHQKSSSTSTPAPRQPAASATSSTRRPSSGYNSKHRPPPRTPSTVDEDTGSEASSETSQIHRHHRKSDEDRKSRRSSLWPPSFMKSSSHKRRHSSDAGYRAPDARSQQVQPSRSDHHAPRAIKPAPQVQQPIYRGPGVPFQWRDPNWDNDSANSTPATPTQAQAQAQMDPRAPSIRFPDQQNFEPLTRESSSGSDHRHRSSASDWERTSTQRRQAQIPPRIATVTGVSGRKYPTADPMSPIERQRTQPRGNVALV